MTYDKRDYDAEGDAGKYGIYPSADQLRPTALEKWAFRVVVTVGIITTVLLVITIAVAIYRA